LPEEAGDAAEPAQSPATTTQREALLEAPISLNEQRIRLVIDAVRSLGPSSVVDLGCGEGKLLAALLKEKPVTRVVGLDVSMRALDVAEDRLKLDRLPTSLRGKIELMHGSLTYRDRRLSGFDCATVIEVIEHLDVSRLAAFERVLFEFARPKAVVLTTPNAEYNVKFAGLVAGQFRHPDHRFEWTRAEFQAWANSVASKRGYSVRFHPIGEADPHLGAPTQLAVFELA
jgi:3' terminal RNA ribose 2'-O-methyltransferase Hen1